jgi:hypothetical protein
MSQINSARALEDPEYAELYMKYLGTLKVLGELASRCDKSEVGMTEEVDACMDDAKEFLAPHITITPHSHFGFRMETTR